MVHTFAKTLTFNWSNLTEGLKLLFCFTHLGEAKMKPRQGMTAWKVIRIKPGNGSSTITFTCRYAVAMTEHSGGITSTSFVEVGPTGGIVDLENGPDNIPRWGPITRVPDASNLIKATNKTHGFQELSIGITRLDRHNVLRYDPAFRWKEVGSNRAIVSTFNPIVTVFVSFNYNGEEFITEREWDSEIWTQNLAKLNANTSWDLILTEEGSYVILSSDTDSEASSPGSETGTDHGSPTSYMSERTRSIEHDTPPITDWI